MEPLHCRQCDRPYGPHRTTTILPCRHSGCSTCSQSPEQLCTLCGIPYLPHEILPNHLAQLALERLMSLQTLQQLHEGIQHIQQEAKQQQGEQEEDLCDGCGQESASISCNQCLSILCEDCDQEIHQFKLFNNHKRITGTQKTQEQPSYTCPIHKDEELNFYCLDDHVMVCEFCESQGSKGKHCGHKIVSIEENAVKDVVEMIENSSTRLTAHSAILHSYVQDVEQCGKDTLRASTQSLDCFKHAVVDAQNLYVKCQQIGSDIDRLGQESIGSEAITALWMNNCLNTLETAKSLHSSFPDSFKELEYAIKVQSELLSDSFKYVSFNNEKKTAPKSTSFTRSIMFTFIVFFGILLSTFLNAVNQQSSEHEDSPFWNESLANESLANESLANESLANESLFHELQVNESFSGGSQSNASRMFANEIAFSSWFKLTLTVKKGCTEYGESIAVRGRLITYYPGCPQWLHSYDMRHGYSRELDLPRYRYSMIWDQLDGIYVFFQRDNSFGQINIEKNTVSKLHSLPNSPSGYANCATGFFQKGKFRCLNNGGYLESFDVKSSIWTPHIKTMAQYIFADPSNDDIIWLIERGGYVWIYDIRLNSVKFISKSPYPNVVPAFLVNRTDNDLNSNGVFLVFYHDRTWMIYDSYDETWVSAESDFKVKPNSLFWDETEKRVYASMGLGEWFYMNLART